MTLTELNQTVRIAGNNARASAGHISRKALKRPVIKLYVFGKWIGPPLFIHTGIFAIKKGSRHGFSYDVGVDDPEDYLQRPILGQYSKGYVEKKRKSWSKFKKSTLYRTKFITLSLLQYYVWDLFKHNCSVDKIELTYNIPGLGKGRNCFTWTGEAVAKAFIIKYTLRL
jgi:hypothetical protein